jgi:hypothetical protein
MVVRVDSVAFLEVISQEQAVFELTDQAFTRV